MRSATNRWLLAALVVGMLATGFVWLNGASGTTQAGGSGAQVKKEDAASRATASMQAPEPGQKKVVLENLGMV